MNQINEFFHRLDANLNMGYSLIRIFLGVILFVRGWLLFADPGAIIDLAGEEKSFLLYAFIAVAHLLGGLFIAIGYFTRTGALIQIPVLFGAAFLVNNDGLMMGGQSYELAVLVLFLLVIYFIFGAGPYSLYDFFQKKKLARTS